MIIPLSGPALHAVSGMIAAGAAFGVHAGITAASIRGGGTKMFGIAYGGIAAFNAIRAGDNLGPF